MESIRGPHAPLTRIKVSSKVRTFVLDTSILLHDPQAIFKFEENNLAIPVEVLEDLDSIKNEENDRGKNARRVHRILQELLPDSRSMHEGVELENGGTLSIIINPYLAEPGRRSPAMDRLRAILPDLSKRDNRVIASALYVQEQYPPPTILVTKDVNVQLKARAVGLESEDYLNEPTPTNVQPQVNEPPPTNKIESLAAVAWSFIGVTHFTSNAPALNDALGISPYVEALTHFIADRQTETPITISIEAPWGMGKTSFMKLMKSRLELRDVLTIWFNPWRHEKSEELWAAFALSLARQLHQGSPRHHRLIAKFKYEVASTDWPSAIPRLLKFALSVFGWGLLVVAGAAPLCLYHASIPEVFTSFDGSPAAIAKSLSMLGGGLGVGAAVFVLLRKLNEVNAWPLATKIQRYMKAPDYASRESFIESFHLDLDVLVRTYANGRKVVVFIDDLDRCDTARAADLIQGINLMISEPGSAERGVPLVFVLGIDRAKLAAGIATRGEKIIPFIHTNEPTDSTASEHTRRGIDYGYEFLDKFVQIPFRLPAADIDEIRHYLENIVTIPAPVDVDAARSDANIIMPKPAIRTGVSEVPAAELDGKPTLSPSLADERWIVHLGELVAPILEMNPRRIKQFVVVLRLQVYILMALGVANKAPIRIGQFAKLLAIGMRWPLFVTDLARCPDLLEQLGRPASDAEPIEVRRWRHRPEFMAAYSCTPSQLPPGSTAREYNISLSPELIAKVLRVSLLPNRVQSQP